MNKYTFFTISNILTVFLTVFVFYMTRHIISFAFLLLFYTGSGKIKEEE